MAISPLQLILLFSILAATASARPCKTLFYFTSTTTTFHPINPQSENPNSYLGIANPRHLTLIFTSTTRFRGLRPFAGNQFGRDFNPKLDSSSIFDREIYPHYNPIIRDEASRSENIPASSSVRDRTKDIMSVVGALLIGVGCGALTAATLFFVWALFSPRSFDFDDVSSDDDEMDEVAATKKKLGYVALPTKVVDDDLKKPALPTQDMV